MQASLPTVRKWSYKYAKGEFYYDPCGGGLQLGVWCEFMVFNISR